MLAEGRRMKPHHVLLFTNYLCFLLGMVIGASLAHNPVLWIIAIILITIAIGFVGTVKIQPRRKRLPPMKRRESRAKVVKN